MAEVGGSIPLNWHHLLLTPARVDWFRPFSMRFDSMSYEQLSDASLLYHYENIRQQAAADISNGRYHFLGEAAKQRAEEIRREIDRRDLFALPINWPSQSE
jgi:hypothetical protein